MKRINSLLGAYTIQKGWVKSITPRLRKEAASFLIRASAFVGVLSFVFPPLITHSLPTQTTTTPESAFEVSSLSVTTPLEEGKRKISSTITAYSSTRDQTDESPFITASNKYVRDGIVAANFLPFGTKIKIPELFGNKVFVVEDRMNRRYNGQHRIDIWFSDRGSAKQFGKKTNIEVIIF